MSEQTSGLVRAIGRWSLVALVINTIIGSGIFGLPGDVAKRVGAAAPLAYLIAALGMGVVMACFAEVASQFPEAGGPYLYARRAFGSFAGVQVGWFAWLVRLTSAAANANLFADYLIEFWEPAATREPRAVLLTALFSLLCAVNLVGVKSGTRVSNIFTIAKLLPLGFFIVAGLALVGSRISVGPSEAPASEWLLAILALIFAFGGFEASLMPMGEAKDARRDAPFALFVGLAVVAVLYTLVHLVVMGALADPSATKRPLAEAARAFLGTPGAKLIAFGALISTYGYLSGQFVSAPRLTFAFAEQRDFPQVFAAVLPRFRTPYISILVYTALVIALAVYGTFISNAILSAVARLFTYAAVCLALPVLRWKQPDAPAFRLPAGWVAAGVGLAFCVVMVMQMGRQHAKIMGGVAVAATLNWAWARFGNRLIAAVRRWLVRA